MSTRKLEEVMIQLSEADDTIAPLFAYRMKYLKRSLIYIVLPLLLASSFQLFFASSALAIEVSGIPQAPNIPITTFNPTSYGGWQTGCHYPNETSFATFKLTAANHDCGATCANTQLCSHFVKTADGSHGTCYLKAGRVRLAVSGDPNYYVCGFVRNPKIPCIGIACPP